MVLNHDMYLIYTYESTVESKFQKSQIQETRSCALVTKFKPNRFYKETLPLTVKPSLFNNLGNGDIGQSISV